MEEEIWKDIAEYEGLYRVSDLGQVKSLNYHRTNQERILKPDVGRNGYLRVELWKNGKHKRFLIHRLVAQAFIANPNNFPLVNHKDEKPKNNCASNLEWCSSSYNINYGTRTKRAVEALSIPVLQLSLQGNVIKRWKSATKAQREGGFIQSHILSCCKGKRHTHKGYKWQYETDYKTKDPFNEALF